MRARIESLGVSSPRRQWGRASSLDHAVRAGRACLEASHYHPEDVAVLINAGVYRDHHYAEPAFACFIQEQLGINVEFQGRQTLSFDLQNGGCGLLSACQAITAMLQAGMLRVGLAISSEANADKNPDPSWCYQPSGAALLLDVSPHGDRGFGSFVFRTLDQHLELYRSAVRLDRKHGVLLLRKDAAVEQVYLEAAGEVLKAVLDAEGLARSDLDLVLPAQISPDFLRALPAAIDMAPDKIVDLGAELGDTLTTSWALALHRARETGRLKDGQRAAILAFGSGVTLGAAIYRA